MCIHFSKYPNSYNFLKLSNRIADSKYIKRIVFGTLITVYIKLKLKLQNVNKTVDFRYDEHKARVKLLIVTNVRHM